MGYHLVKKYKFDKNKIQTLIFNTTETTIKRNCTP